MLGRFSLYGLLKNQPHGDPLRRARRSFWPAQVDDP